MLTAGLCVWLATQVTLMVYGSEVDKGVGISSMSVPTSTVTNLLTFTNGIPARYTAPDRGEAIPYLIDNDYLPSGISTNEAFQAVQSALGAWSAVSSMTFAFKGYQSFGQASANITNGDGILRIQLHDHYNYLGSATALGFGGEHYFTTTLTNTSWTLGGNVKGNDFYLVSNPYMGLNSTNTFLSDTNNLAELICHELGHAFGLANSSQNPNETNPILSNSIMYFQAHGNGRGATLSAYDSQVIQQSQPVSNLPPYLYPRVMHIVTSATNISNPTVNLIQVRGYSLETKSLSIATNGATKINGSFLLLGAYLKYTPSSFFNDFSYSPAGNTYLDEVFARCTDGTNSSPYVPLRVISFGADGFAEGIPNSWRSFYFGSITPFYGSNHHASDDADGDGYSNLLEFQLGSNPNDPLSNFRLITNTVAGTIHWQAYPYEVYEIWASTNLTDWKMAVNPVTPTNSTPTVVIGTNGYPSRFFRVVKVP
jgi:hypothetical protein